MTDHVSDIDGAGPVEKTSLDLAKEALAGNDIIAQSVAAAAIAEDIIGGGFDVSGMSGCEKLVPAFCLTLREICKREGGLCFTMALKEMVVSASRVMVKIRGDGELSDVFLGLVGKLETPEARLNALMGVAPKAFARWAFVDRENQKIGADLVEALLLDAGCFDNQVNPVLRAKAAFAAFCGAVRLSQYPGCEKGDEESQRVAADIIVKAEDDLLPLFDSEMEMFVEIYREIAANAKVPEVAELATGRWIGHLKTLDPVRVQEKVDDILFAAGDKYGRLVRACFKESELEAQERRSLPTREAMADFMVTIASGSGLGDGPP